MAARAHFVRQGRLVLPGSTLWIWPPPSLLPAPSAQPDYHSMPRAARRTSVSGALAPLLDENWRPRTLSDAFAPLSSRGRANRLRPTTNTRSRSRQGRQKAEFSRIERRFQTREMNIARRPTIVLRSTRSVSASANGRPFATFRDGCRASVRLFFERTLRMNSKNVHSDQMVIARPGNFHSGRIRVLSSSSNRGFDFNQSSKSSRHHPQGRAGSWRPLKQDRGKACD